MKKETKILIVIFFITLFARILIIFSSGNLFKLRNITGYFLCDDAYYSLGIARNIADGLGPTHDTIHKTNGYQPLYVFLMVPFYFYFNAINDTTTPVFVALFLLSVFNSLIAVFLFKLSKLLSKNRYLPYFAAIVWMLSPDIIGKGINGLETSISSFLIIFTLYFYIKRVKPNFQKKDVLILSILLGLNFLARIDSAIFAVAIGVDILYFYFQQKKLKSGVKTLVLLALVSTLLYFPFVGYSYYHAKRIFPDSGKAVRQVSIVTRLDDDSKVAHFYSNNIKKSFLTSILNTPLFPDFKNMFKIRDDYFLYLDNLFLISSAFLIFILIIFRYSKKSFLVHNSSYLTVVAVYSTLMILSYSFFVFGDYYFERYYYSIVMLFIPVFLGLTASKIIKWIFTTIFVLNIVFGILNFKHIYEPTTNDVSVVLKKASQMSDGKSKIGAFQSGELQYFNPYYFTHPVINLDGVVNFNAYLAIKEGKLHEYLKKMNIKFMVDMPMSTIFFIKNKPQIKFKEIFHYRRFSLFKIE